MTKVTWRLLAEQAFRAVRSSLTMESEHLHDFLPPKNLRSIAQCLVFRVCLSHLFLGGDDSALSQHDIEIMVKCTNELFALLPDKSRGQLDPDVLDLRNSLDNHLRSAFVASGVPFPAHNPMNHLLVAYGANERVVLRCFLEVRFRMETGSYTELNALFELFTSRPAGGGFETRANEMCVSVKDIVNEALRVYPPPKSITREIGYQTYVIDVEHIQRDEAIWGPDAHRFNPRRWSSIVGAPRAFMPFGKGPLSCPTQFSFGPKFIGVMVGALVANINETYVLFGLGSEEVLGANGALQAGREAYPNLLVGTGY